jgi:hypothetical protein
MKKDMKLATLALVAVAAVGCSHTETVRQPQTPRTQAAESPPRKGTVSRENVREGGPPVPVSPEGELAPGQLEKIQDRLVRRGMLERKSGGLDETTRAALKKFQKSQDIPETGLPDQETVKRLGLDPDQVFARKEARGS